MCKALEELFADARNAGIAIGTEAGRKAGIEIGKKAGIENGRKVGFENGIEEKTRQIITNMLNRGMSDEDIRAIAECSQAAIDRIREQLSGIQSF